MMIKEHFWNSASCFIKKFEIQFQKKQNAIIFFFFKEFYFNLSYLCRKYSEYHENFPRFFVFVITKAQKGIYNSKVFN